MKGTSARRGNVAITALSLSGLLGFSALAIDLGYVRVVNIQLQTALEAGVLGGTAYLDGTVDGANLAHSKAIELAGLNPILGGQALDANAFQLGTWSEADGFQAVNMPPSEAQAKKINAMRVAINYSGIPAILAGVAYKQDTLSTAAAAMAVRSVGGPAGSVDCYLPIALPACAFNPNAQVNPDPIRVTPDNEDTMGWAIFGGGSANQNAVKEFFQDGQCSSAGVTDAVHVQNGVGNGMSHVRNILNGNPHPMVSDWMSETGSSPFARNGTNTFCLSGDNTCINTLKAQLGIKGNSDQVVSGVNGGSWGRVIGGPIALVGLKQGSEASCIGGAPNWKWNNKSDLEVKGFTWGYIYEINKSNGSPAVYIQLDFVNEHDFGTGTHPEAVGNIVVKDGPPKLVAP